MTFYNSHYFDYTVADINEKGSVIDESSKLLKDKTPAITHDLQALPDKDREAYYKTSTLEVYIFAIFSPWTLRYISAML